jgi:hypothetical protein
MEAISEARSDIGERGRPPYDDTYGMSPVNYVKLDRLPTVDDEPHYQRHEARRLLHHLG